MPISSPFPSPPTGSNGIEGSAQVTNYSVNVFITSIIEKIKIRGLIISSEYAFLQ
jgi:hypothetical protein